MQRKLILRSVQFNRCHIRIILIGKMSLMTVLIMMSAERGLRSVLREAIVDLCPLPVLLVGRDTVVAERGRFGLVPRLELSDSKLGPNFAPTRGFMPRAQLRVIMTFIIRCARLVNPRVGLRHIRMIRSGRT